MKRILAYVAWGIIASLLLWYALSGLLQIPSFNTNKDIVSVITPIMGFIATILTYMFNLEEKRNRVFARMNKVFVRDENIQSVIRFMNNREKDEPSVNELELFLRFFEELDVYVKSGDIDCDVVYHLFYYYCGQLLHAQEYQFLREKMGLDLEKWEHLKDIDNKMQKKAMKIKS